MENDHVQWKKTTISMAIVHFGKKLVGTGDWYTIVLISPCCKKGLVSSPSINKPMGIWDIFLSPTIGYRNKAKHSEGLWIL